MERSVQQLEALAVLAQLCLLGLAISIGHWLRRRNVLWIGSAGAALLLGVGVGLIVRLADTAPVVEAWMMFQSDFFFLVLLPPIMFDACFNLDVRLFIKNIGSVCTLAFYGTTASTFAMGFNMWGAGQLGLCYKLNLLQAFTFGALISATDPVTVLAVFQQLGAQPDLYMNVFGESVLNDAVAMALFQTLDSFAEHEVPVSAASIIRGAAAFCGVFLGSMLLGVVIGFAAAALLRPRWCYGEVNMETGLVLLFGYGSYMAGTATGLSGIVCVMFCAMVMGSYAGPNMSPGGLQASRGVYAVLASTMEVFVFVYIGLSLFMEPQEWHMVHFMGVCLFGLAWSRAVNVLPSCAAVNYLRPADMAIPARQQLLLWWSGLRGAMAFALSVEAAKNFGEPGKVMMTATFMSILCTVLVNGGSTGYLLAYCGLVQQPKQQQQQQQRQHSPHQHTQHTHHQSLLLGTRSRECSSGSLCDAERVQLLQQDAMAQEWQDRSRGIQQQQQLQQNWQELERSSEAGEAGCLLLGDGLGEPAAGAAGAVPAAAAPTLMHGYGAAAAVAAAADGSPSDSSCYQRQTSRSGTAGPVTTSTDGSVGVSIHLDGSHPAAGSCRAWKEVSTSTSSSNDAVCTENANLLRSAAEVAVTPASAALRRGNSTSAAAYDVQCRAGGRAVPSPAAGLVRIASEGRLLDSLREATRHGLQTRLDSWHARLFSMLINPDSAAEHNAAGMPACPH